MLEVHIQDKFFNVGRTKHLLQSRDMYIHAPTRTEMLNLLFYFWFLLSVEYVGERKMSRKFNIDSINIKPASDLDKKKKFLSLRSEIL